MKDDTITPDVIELFPCIKDVSLFLTYKTNKDDLMSFLKACEEQELYEYCIIINNKINEN